MANIFQIKRGAHGGTTLADGELGLKTDEGKLYIGNGGANVGVVMDEELVAVKAELNGAIAGTAPANHTHTAAEVGARPSTWVPNKWDVGLGNVDNTSDGQKSVNYANTSGNTNAVGGRASSTVLSEIDNLKTSVANGKAQIASAISDKGVSTGAGADFGTMANNIRAIKTSASWSAMGGFSVKNGGTTVDISKYQYVVIIGSTNGVSSSDTYPGVLIDVQNGQAFNFNERVMDPRTGPYCGGSIDVYRGGTFNAAAKTLTANRATMSCVGIY